MYNDYYLQEINNNIIKTNNYLKEISQKQDIIIENQYISYSGDLINNNNLCVASITTNTSHIILFCILFTLVFESVFSVFFRSHKQ